MALISQEALLGMLVPDIYIDGVTLESSGTPAIVDNPHIDDIREKISLQQFEDAKDNRTMRVTVDMSLKETLDNSLIGSWFREQEFHKYLKIQIFQTTHPGLIKLFSYSQNMINLVTEGTSTANANWSDEERRAIEEACGSPAKAFEVLSNKNLYQHRVLSVSADVVGDNSDLTQISSSIDSDGNSIHDFTYRAVFELSVLNPDELAVFAVSYLDLGALKADYDLEFDVGTLDNQNGKVASEKIITKGAIVSTAMVFTTPDGEYWTGPVHSTGRFSYASGSEPSSTSVKLNKRNVPNDVVQDFRDVAEIMKYSLDVTPVDKAIDSISGIKSRSNDREFIEHKKTHFSNLWISRDPDGASRFMFAFDKKSFLQHNSIYGFLLDRNSPEIRNQILDYSKIRQMTVVRRRVQSAESLNKLGSISTGHVLFDRGEPYKSLIMTAADETGRIAESSNALASIRESYPTVTNLDSTLGVHYYTGQDREMSKFTDGLYQYGIRIDVEDGTHDYLRDICRDLINQKEDIKMYLEASLKLGMTKILAEIADPHIDHSSERQASVRENKGHYDPLRNRFTSRFIDFMDLAYEDETSPFYKKQPWIDAALSYTNAISVLSKEAESAVFLKEINLDEKISKFMSPASGTPMGIMAVMSLYDTLISKFRTLTGDDYRSRGRASMSPAGSRQTSSSHVSTGQNASPHMLEVENWFYENHFDSNVKKSMGLDYLTNSATRNDTSENKRQGRSMAMREYADLALGSYQNRGLKIIDGGYWQSRIQTETLKYFSDNNPNINLSYGKDVYTDSDVISNTSFGFLSPSYVVANSRAYTMSLGQEMSYYVKVEADLLAENSNRFVVLDDDTATTNRTTAEKLYQSTLQNIFSDLNVVVTTTAVQMPIPQIYSSQTQEDQTLCESQQLQAVDPYPAWNMDEQGNVVALPSEENKEVPVGEKNSNFTDFFKKVSDIAISDSVVAGNLNRQSTPLLIQRFDARDSGSVFSNLKEDGRLASRIMTSNGLTQVQPTVSNVVRSFPNQIKSIFHAPLNPGVVRDNWNEMDGWLQSSKFNLNYQFLSMVERFDGFDYVKTTNGAGRVLSVKRERWVQLTEQYYSTSEGQEIVCRLTPYACESLGITRKSGIDAPIYDEYFVIVPQRKGKIITRRVNTRAQRRTAMISRWRRSALTRGQFSTTNLITK